MKPNPTPAGLRCARSTSYAQLSRVHVVTPKSSAAQPVAIGFDPKIQLRPARGAARKLVVGLEPRHRIWFEPESRYTVQLPRVFGHDGKAIILPVEDPAARPKTYRNAWGRYRQVVAKAVSGQVA